MKILSREQLDRTLLSRDVVDGLERLQQDGTLLAMFPEVHAMVGFGGGDTGHKDLWGHTKQVVSQCVPRVTVRWAALFHDIGKVKCFTKNAKGEVSFHHHEAVSAQLFKRIQERTRIFGDDAKHIHFLVYNLGYIEGYEPNWTDSAVRRVHKHVGMYFDDLIALARADITTKHDSKRQKHHARMHEFNTRAKEIAAKDAIPPALPKGLGDAITKEFNIPPSEALGKIMKALKDAVETGDLERQPSVETALQYIREHGLV